MAFQTDSFQGNAFQEHVTGGAAATPTGWDMAIDSMPSKTAMSAALLASIGMAVIPFPVNNQYAPVTQSAGGPTYDRVVQYQALAFVPVVVAAGETITVDKWFVQNAEVTRTLPRPNIGSGVVAGFVPIIPSYGWNVQQLDQTPRPPKATPSVTVLGVPPTVTVDWLASSSGVRYPQAWRQYNAGVDVLYVPPVTPAAVAIDWYVQQVEVTARPSGQATQYASNYVAPLTLPTITMDRWFVQAQPPPKAAPTNILMSMSFVMDPFPLPGTPPAVGGGGEENWIVPWRKRRHVIGG